jgi:Uma2 family endonuclease
MDEHDLYPVHEEDNVPENSLHYEQTRYLSGALATYRPDKWVTGNICMYWEERNFHLYAAPDVLVVDCERPDPLPKTYLRWADPPPLLVIEIGSESTFMRDEGPKLETYGFYLGVPEYLYYHPDRRDLRFYRLREGGYEAVLSDERRWVYSETLEVWFGLDETGWLRLYTPTGERLRSHEEESRARQEAEVRAAALAQQLAALEAELQRLRVSRDG